MRVRKRRSSPRERLINWLAAFLTVRWVARLVWRGWRAA
jgi:hypothetical protein